MGPHPSSRWYDTAVRMYLALVAACVACSSNDSPDPGNPGAPDGGVACVEPATDFPETGLFARPSDFDRSSCVAGSMADFDSAGLWFMQAEDQPKFSAGPVRVRSTCESGLTVSVAGIATSTEMETAVQTDDDLFFRRERAFEEFSFVQAYDLCAVDGQGRPSGRAVSCFVSEQFGENCSEREVTLEPFGRIAGESEASGLELVAEYAGPPGAPWPADFTANVAYHGDVAYVARGSDAVRIVDIADLTAPVELSTFPAESDNFNDLAVVPTADKVYLLVASAAFGVIVVDVTDPAAPDDVLRFAIEEGAGVHRLWVDRVGDTYRAYLAEGNWRVVGLWDVTDPAAPVKIGTYDTGDDNWGVHALFARGQDVYVNATSGGMLALRLEDDIVPGQSIATQVGRYVGPDGVFSHASMPTTTSSGQRIVIHGEEGFDSPFQIVDDEPTSPTYMQLIGELELREQVSIHNFHVVGDRAYVAHYQDGVRVIDFSDPTDPTLVSYFNTWDPDTAPGALLEGAVDIEVRDDGTILVADTPRGLLILRPGS